MSETTSENWSQVLESMTDKDHDDFLKWWQGLSSDVVKQAASGHNWQALIAKAWRAARKEQGDG